MIWTEANVEALKAHAAQGLSASRIGVRMGCTRNCIIGKCRRLGITLQGKPSGRSKAARKKTSMREDVAEANYLISIGACL